MKRRTFLHSLGAGAALLPVYPNWCWASEQPTTDDLLREWIEINDRDIDSLLTRQERREDHRGYGGFPDRNGIYWHGGAAGATKEFAAGYVTPASRHYRSTQVDQAMAAAVDFLRRVQHPDGTIDLLSTNFYSTPDTGFVVESLALALSTIKQQAPEELVAFQAGAEEFLTRAGAALTTGGVHTPNHRWVVCMALSWIHTLFPDPRYVARIDRWLREGIDIDADGQYTEQSVAGYTPLVNRCLITIARLLPRPELLEPVRRNLDMTKYYFHANGELVTEASRRQDKYRVATGEGYYYSYRYLAIADQNGEFAAMTRLLEDTVIPRRLSENLIRFCEDPALKSELPPPAPLPTDYAKTFPNSNLVRIRRSQIDATILAENSTFFTFHKKDAVLQAVRCATAFFGKGQFVSPTVCADGNEYVLRQDLVAGYYQPFPEDRVPGDGDWEKMPRIDRQQTGVRRLISRVVIREEAGQFRLMFDIQGTENVPLAIELAFRKDGEFDGVIPLEDIPDAYLLKQDQGQYRSHGQVIRFGPGRAEHSWTQLRGADPKLDAQSVYLTGFTPFQFELLIS